jgi:hypothetical protein
MPKLLFQLLVEARGWFGDEYRSPTVPVSLMTGVVSVLAVPSRLDACEFQILSRYESAFLMSSVFFSLMAFSYKW